MHIYVYTKMSNSYILCTIYVFNFIIKLIKRDNNSFTDISTAKFHNSGRSPTCINNSIRPHYVILMFLK